MPKILNAANGVKLFGKNTKTTAKLQKEFAALTKEAAKSAAEESGQLKTLKKAIEDTNLPMKNRVNAIKTLQEKYPEYFKNLKQEDLLNGKVADAYNLAAEGILKKARAQAASNKSCKQLKKYPISLLVMQGM